MLKCGNPLCGHVVEAAAAELIPSDRAPAENVHRVIDNRYAGQTIGCYVCGHFTEYLRGATT